MSKRILLGSLLAALLLLTGPALAAEVQTNTLGISGYDLVSYHDGAKPLRGNGNHVAVHEGVTYLFASDAHRKAFEREPERYVPAYGGFCAYGVSVGKKFVGDPDVWKLRDGRLFLNLDNKVKGLWRKDIPGRIRTADQRWASIRDKAPADL